MSTHGFDEMQLATRNRIASETLALTLIAVFAANWLGDTWHIWATGLQQSLVIFWIAFGYFGARAIWSHAYFRANVRAVKLWRVIIGTFILALAYTLIKALLGRLQLTSGSHLSDEALLLFFIAGYGAWAVSALARRWADRREDGPERQPER